MGKYWVAFEQEFNRIAKGKQESSQELLEALYEHVQASISDQKDDIPGEEMERIAVERLGTPRTILARTLDRRKVVWLPASIALLGLTWCAAWMIVGSQQLSMHMVIPVLILTPIAVFASSLISGRSKFWALGGITATLALATLIVMSFSWLNLRLSGGRGYIARWDAAAGIAGIDQEVLHQDAVLSDLVQAQTAFRRGDQKVARQHAYLPGRGWKVPTPYWLGYRVPQFDYRKDFEEARGIWSKRSGALIQALNDYRDTSIDDRNAISDSRSLNPKVTFLDNAPSFAGVSLICYLVLAGAHGLGLSICALREAIDRKRWKAVLRA